MKIFPLILTASLAANAALVGFFLLRSPAARDGATAVPLSATARPASNAAAGSVDTAALQTALASGDPVALAALGFSPDSIRFLSVGRAFDRFQAAISVMRPGIPPDGKYWQPPAHQTDPRLAQERRTEGNKAQREFSDAIRVAYGTDLDSVYEGRARHDFLPLAKRDQLRRIEQDYAELQAQIEAGIQDGVQLPADREKMDLLRREKERDIAAALTPAEREQMELHTSNTANTVRYRFGAVLQTEEDYRKIYALQKAFDDRFSGANAGASARQNPTAAMQRLEEEIRAALTPEQLATLRHNNDPDRRTAASLAQRLGLPATTTDAVLATRERYAALSLQINADRTRSAAERSAKLKSLAADSLTELQAALGPDGAEAYAPRAPWLNMLKAGNAFSTNPKDAPNAMNTLTGAVFQVPVSGTPASRPVPPGGG